MDYLIELVKWWFGVAAGIMVGGVLIWFVAYQVCSAYFKAKERFIRRHTNGWRSEKEVEGEKQREEER